MSVRVTDHSEELVPLRRIEGQVRGIQRMIEENRYCIDIMTQLAAVMGALKRTEESILERHLKGCVQSSFNHGTEADRQSKVDEVIGVLKKFRR